MTEEVFAYAKVKLPCSGVLAIARVKLILLILPEPKLHYPEDNFTYEVKSTCPCGKLSMRSVLMGTTHFVFANANLVKFSLMRK